MLGCAGYSGVFKQRTGDKQDGCATFWQDDKFVLQRIVPVEYLIPGVSVLDRDNVALLVLLRPRDAASNDAGSDVTRDAANVCVANTHLLFNPRRGDVKLAQAMVLMAEIEKLSFVQHVQKTGQGKYCPVLLCGDFNCEPFCDLYKFFGRGFLDYEGLLMRTMSGQEEGRFGSDRYFGRQVIPPRVGITDKCQYAMEVRRRWEQYTTEGRKRNKRCVSVEDQQTGEKATATKWKDVVDTTESKEKEAAKQSAEKADDSEATVNTEEAEITGEKYGEDEDSDVIDLTDEPAKAETSKREASPSKTEPSTSSKAKNSELAQPFYDQCTGVVSHKIKFVSVYNHDNNDGGNFWREATTKHGRANCTVDYIFYSVENRKTKTHRQKFRYNAVREGRLRLVGKLKLASERQLNEAGCLPNEAVSSDHTVLMAKFSLSLDKV